MNWNKITRPVAAAGLCALVGFFVGRCTTPATTTAGVAPPGKSDAATRWTCPMHPEVDLPAFGPCPKCGMDLVPRAAGGALGPRRIAMTEEARKLAEIATVPVTRQFLTLAVRMSGKIEFDETAIRTIAARVEGRIDRMFVDYTGVPVRQGDHLVSLFSPALLTAQQELLEAKKRRAATAGEASQFLRDSNEKAYRAARDKLLLWGLSAAQVDAVEQRGTAEDHMEIRSPAGGVVIHKLLDQGDYVREGSKIYRIADLERLWLRLDAYEQDLPWLRFGQRVTVQAEAVPGEVFEGRIAFLDPVLQDRTRTVKVRVNIANPDRRLKPGMFVRAVVRAQMGGNGEVLESRLAGKWISPMHPEVVKDGPGKCDVCGMDLVPAESLGYVPPATAQKPLVVPASAVLVTGTRAVVYVAVPDQARPTYEGREVILGPRAGDYYLVRAGLREHERVVTNGAFRIDSSMQIQAKPSMMSMPGESMLFVGPDTAVLRVSLGPLGTAYFALQQALARDDLGGSQAAARQATTALSAADPAGIPAAAARRFGAEVEPLRVALRDLVAASDLAGARLAFATVSRHVLELERTFRHPGEQLHFEVFCPMAFDDRGAAWLQQDKTVANPYFGARMLRCGEIRTEFVGVSTTIRQATETPGQKAKGNK
ncbi:MAG: efflux RND transporter periplasmic adaptor subunit [Planctomycetes bacterium]|nr:efflux RND transporter periplasmic adaptor subunit [Planctomycetota bacterium]